MRFSGASTYNKLSRIMILCCCTHNNLIQCNHSYMIPEYDALYYLKRQWYYEFVLFLSNQPGIDILILGGDVARRYVHRTFGLEKLRIVGVCIAVRYALHCWIKLWIWIWYMIALLQRQIHDISLSVPSRSRDHNRCHTPRKRWSMGCFCDF